MLNKIKKSSDFAKARSSGLFYSCKTLSLQKNPNNAEQPRFGFTISKKVSKRAVDRNLIRRRLHHIIRELPQDIFASGFDYVLIAKKDSLSRNFTDLRGDVSYLCRKISEK